MKTSLISNLITKRKLKYALLGAVFVFSAFIGGYLYNLRPARAAGPATVVYVGSHQSCQTTDMSGSCSGTGWRYDKPSETLILDGLNLDNQGAISASGGDFKIHLKGNNIITDNLGASLIKAAGVNEESLTITADTGAKMTINAANKFIGMIDADGDIRINGGTVVLNHTYAGSDCRLGNDAMIDSNSGKVIIEGTASLTATGQSCYTGGGIPDSIIRAVNGIELRTSGSITGTITATDDVVDHSRMVALASTGTTLSNNLVFGGTGVYNFTAPQQVLAADGYGMIGAKLEDAQTIQTPSGASFNAEGILVDAGNNDIRATTNNLVIKRSATDLVVNFDCGPNGTCTRNPDQAIYNQDADVMIDIEANDGYEIESVEINGVAQPEAVDQTNWSLNLTVNEDKTIKAVFKKIPAAPRTLTLNCGANGACTKDPDQAIYDDGSNATVYIVADAGYVIKSLKINGVEDASAVGLGNLGVNITMNADKTVTVEFEDAKPTLLTDKPSLKQGEDLTITIKNLDPSLNGKIAEFWINSTPVKLGEVTIVNGMAELTATIPCNIPAGEHTITVKVDGNLVGDPDALEQKVTLLASQACQAEQARLSETGQDGMVMIAAASMIVLLGGAVLVARKRLLNY